MNAITPVTAEPAGETRDGGTDVLYTPGERIFAMAGPMVRAQGWSIFPQERVGKRRPGRTREGAIRWGCLCDEPASDENLALWRKDCAKLNVACAFGPASGNAFALDVDCMDATVSARVQAIAAAVLGPTPFTRIGRAPKVALICRYDGDEPLRNRAAELAGMGDCKLEVLAAGKSLPFHGLHHQTGRWFQWPDQNPLTSSLTEAPEVSAATVDAFLQAVAQEFPFKEPPFRLPCPALGVAGVADGIIVPARLAAAAGPMTDDREGYLRDLAWGVVLQNAAMLTGAHGKGRLEKTAARVVADAVYGVGELEMALRRVGRGYVLGGAGQGSGRTTAGMPVEGWPPRTTSILGAPSCPSPVRARRLAGRLAPRRGTACRQATVPEARGCMTGRSCPRFRVRSTWNDSGGLPGAGRLGGGRAQQGAFGNLDARAAGAAQAG